jgi:hypothetical protein
MNHGTNLERKTKGISVKYFMRGRTSAWIFSIFKHFKTWGLLVIGTILLQEASGLISLSLVAIASPIGKLDGSRRYVLKHVIAEGNLEDTLYTCLPCPSAFWSFRLPLRAQRLLGGMLWKKHLPVTLAYS